MKILTLLLTTIFLSNIYSQTADQIEVISEKINEFPINTQLSIGFIKNGEVNYLGVKRVNDTIQKVDNSKSLFEIGSITKVFTSTLLANLVLEKQVKLNKPIQDYLDFPINNNKITLKQLANHTSGLSRLPDNLDLTKADPTNPYKDYDKENLKSFLMSDFEINNSPGSNYIYSNAGAGVLGYILPEKSGLTYEELLKKYIFSKYDMNNSTTNISNVTQTMVGGLDSLGNKTDNWNLNALVGAGGIISNIEDLSKFVLAQFNEKDKSLKLTRKSTFKIPEYRMEVGLAWNIIKPDKKNEWYIHNGGSGGYTSIMAFDVKNETGIVILSNVSAFNKYARNIDQLCIELMKTLYQE
jgi:CubicO group peptidase (beta-lactamase class C family)